MTDSAHGLMGKFRPLPDPSRLQDLLIPPGHELRKSNCYFLKGFSNEYTAFIRLSALGAYLIFGPPGWALIRDGRLFEAGRLLNSHRTCANGTVLPYLYISEGLRRQ